MNDSIMFPVIETPIMAGSSALDPSITFAGGFKALVRPDTGDVLGIHSTKYKLVTNEEGFGKFEDSLERSGLDTNGMFVKDTMDHKGARCVREYRLPEHRIDIGGDDYVDLMLRAVNSYDGSQRFGYMFGGYRLVCSNGLVIGKTIASFGKKHTQTLDVDQMVAQLQRSVNEYSDSEPMWRKWAKTTITHEQAMVLFECIAKRESRTHEQLLTMWLQEKAILGSTAWAAYQVLTAWSTHQKARKNHGTAMLEREERVRKALPTLDRLAA